MASLIVAATLLATAACSIPGASIMDDRPPTRLAATVLSVDTADQSLRVFDAGSSYTVRLTPDTILRQGREEIDLAELERGDRIVVVSTVPGPGLQAKLITVAGPALRAPEAIRRKEEP